MNLQSNISQIQFISLPFIRRIEKVEFEYPYADVAQITSDAMQEWGSDLMDEYDRNELVPDSAGAFCYKASLLIEVMNPVLVLDIKILKEMLSIGREWQKEVELNMKADE
jgi:hypothetical protein